MRCCRWQRSTRTAGPGPPAVTNSPARCPVTRCTETADGRFVAVGALEKKFWDSFCTLIDRVDLQAHHRPAAPAQAEWVRAELQVLIGAQSLAWWTDKLRGADCCVTPVLTLVETLANEQFLARGMVVPGTTASGQPFVQLACPLKMSGFRVCRAAPGAAPGPAHRGHPA
ncbi:CoA transferase [Polaromonas sp. P1(28)-13]|nr:CoA transferase [Polaromonas sp. P1(28)-13]